MKINKIKWISQKKYQYDKNKNKKLKIKMIIKFIISLIYLMNKNKKMKLKMKIKSIMNLMNLMNGNNKILKIKMNINKLIMSYLHIIKMMLVCWVHLKIKYNITPS